MSLTINKQSTSHANCSNSEKVGFGFVPEFNYIEVAPEEKIVRRQTEFNNLITMLKAKGAGENYQIVPK